MYSFIKNDNNKTFLMNYFYIFYSLKKDIKKKTAQKLYIHKAYYCALRYQFLKALIIYIYIETDILKSSRFSSNLFIGRSKPSATLENQTAFNYHNQVPI